MKKPNSLEYNEYNLNLPVDDDKIRQLKAGDFVYLSGIIITGRDHFHKRVIEYQLSKKELPNDFKLIKDGCLYHMGPIVKFNQDKTYTLISGGPTTSARMNSFQTQVCNILGCKIVIGKGGMENVRWNDIPAIYLQYPGGTGALFSKFVKKVRSVEWLDLGSPEAAWILEVKNFGPLLVAIDTHGGNLFQH